MMATPMMTIMEMRIAMTLTPPSSLGLSQLTKRKIAPAPFGVIINPGVHDVELVTGSAVFAGTLNADGKKQGHGSLRWDDGDVFEGEFDNDERVHGTFRWKGGDTYTGEWKNSLMHGKGHYIYKDGREYDGEWKCGFRHGLGVLRYPTGDRYQGQFQNDVFSGHGEYRYADNRIYKGQYENDKKHGFGILVWPNGEKTEGYWEANLMHGVAIVTDAEGHRFQERWNNGNREGNRQRLKRTDMDMQLLLSSTAQPAWQPDSAFKECFSCSAHFSLVNRRHHCRMCGLVYCTNCTSRKMPLPKIGEHKDCRVCDECFLAVRCNEAATQLKAF